MEIILNFIEELITFNKVHIQDVLSARINLLLVPH